MDKLRIAAWKAVQEAAGLPCRFIIQHDPKAGRPPTWTNSWTCAVTGQCPVLDCSCLECVFQELKIPSWLSKFLSNQEPASTAGVFLLCVQLLRCFCQPFLIF